MNGEQAENFRREAEALRDRKGGVERPSRGGDVLVGGVAKIVSNDGDGAYTITQQVYDSGTSAWIAAVAPSGLVAVTAREYQNRTTGAAADYVRFWQQRRADGAVEVLIDIGGGVEAHTVLDEDVHTDTEARVPVKGDIIYCLVNGTWIHLAPPGVAGKTYILSVNDTNTISWREMKPFVCP